MYSKLLAIVSVLALHATAVAAQTCKLPAGTTSNTGDCNNGGAGCTVHALKISGPLTCDTVNGYGGSARATGSTACDGDGQTFTNVYTCVALTCKLPDAFTTSNTAACASDGSGCTVTQLQASTLSCAA